MLYVDGKYQYNYDKKAFALVYKCVKKGGTLDGCWVKTREGPMWKSKEAEALDVLRQQKWQAERLIVRAEEQEIDNAEKLAEMKARA